MAVDITKHNPEDLDVKINENKEGILLIERPREDCILRWEIFVKIDKKKSGKLRPGEKLEIPVSEGKHLISLTMRSYSFLLSTGARGSLEFDYPRDNHILVACSGLKIMCKVIDEEKETEFLKLQYENGCKYNLFAYLITRETGIVNLYIFQDCLKFRKIENESLFKIPFDKIQNISITKDKSGLFKNFSRIFIQLFTGERYAFMVSEKTIPQEILSKAFEFLNSVI